MKKINKREYISKETEQKDMYERIQELKIWI